MPVHPLSHRLLERGRRYQEKLAAAQREAEEAPRDAATGRLLFQPKTHRPPIYDRNPDGGLRAAAWNVLKPFGCSLAKGLSTGFGFGASLEMHAVWRQGQASRGR